MDVGMEIYYDLTKEGQKELKLRTIRRLPLKNLKVKIINFLFIIWFCALTGCKSNEELISKKIIGNWDVVKFEYKNTSHLNNLLINYISFQKENKFSIPEIFKYPAEDGDDNTYWSVKIDQNVKIKLVLKCENKIFQGKYNVHFFKDYDKNLLGIELTSKTTYIKAFKALQNFNTDGIGWEE